MLRKVEDTPMGACVLVDDVFLQGGFKYLNAWDWRRGTSLWKKNLGKDPEKWLSGIFAATEDLTVFGLGGGPVVCVETRTGKEVWRATVGDLTWTRHREPEPGHVRGPIVIHRDHVIVEVWPNHVVALSLRDGRREWTYEGYVEEGHLYRDRWGAGWSADGQWLYYVDGAVLKKIPASGGAATTVRSERVRNAIGMNGGTLYYVVERPLVDGRPEFEIHAANPDNGPSRVLNRVPAARVASWQIVNPSLSPDGQWLALPLTDGFTTNVWALSTTTGQWRQVTDFGDRATFVARRVSWSGDGRFILAAVGDGDADIVLADGLLRDRKP